jgi:integrase
MKQHITPKLIEKLEIPESGNVIVYDRSVRGFGVRTTSNGVKSFILNYRVKGRERRYTIARCDEWSVTAARDEAEKLRGQISQGADPMEHREEERGAPTFSELAGAYMEAAEAHKRASTLRNDRSMMKILKAHIGNRKAGDVHHEDLARLHRSLKATPYRANRMLALASAVFTWAAKDDHSRKLWNVSENPAKGIKRFQEEPRQTALSQQQLEALEAALAAYSESDAADAIRLLILTGSREREVLSAEWSQFDLKRGVWTKPSHHTKQRKTEHVPLNRPARKLLERMAENKSGPYLFPGRQLPGRQSDKAPRVTIHRPWVQVCKAAGLAEEIRIPGKRGELKRYKPTVRIHDLRHSFASYLVSKGESLYIVGKLLGHTRPQTTQRYAHLQDESLREAANRFWPDYGSKKGKKVVKMKERA